MNPGVAVLIILAGGLFTIWWYIKNNGGPDSFA